MTQVDLANQVKGTLPKANVEDLGTIDTFMGDLNTLAVNTGYVTFVAMLTVFIQQIELNREASGAAPAAGYFDPTP